MADHRSLPPTQRVCLAPRAKTHATHTISAIFLFFFFFSLTSIICFLVLTVYLGGVTVERVIVHESVVTACSVWTFARVSTSRGICNKLPHETLKVVHPRLHSNQEFIVA